MQDVIDIEVTPLSAGCGAEIKGVDLTRPVSESAVRAIKQAWARHLVLLFRGQTLSQDDQLRFASYFGTLGNRKRAPAALRDRAHHKGRPVSGRGRVAQPPAGRSGLGPRRREDHRVTLCRSACAGRAYTGDGGAVARRRRTGGYAVRRW
jgi:alpha-ketoglutarate-dependent taurine dioxygenase